MSGEDDAIQASDVHKRFGATRVLCGVDFRAASGQLVAILGENGSGKSTLLRILAGAEALDHGVVQRRAAVGYAPQDTLLHPHLTPDEHVHLFAAAYGLSREQASASAGHLFEQLGLSTQRRKLVHTLSGGTRQKLNLVLALLHDPPILLLDEPYAGLDGVTYERVLTRLVAAKAKGKCVVVVTHLLLQREPFDAVYDLVGGRLRAA